MARSFVATRYQLGFVFYAAAETFSLKAAAAVGACAANRTFFSAGLRSWAKSVFTPASVSFRKPAASGRTSDPMGAGLAPAPREFDGLAHVGREGGDVNKVGDFWVVAGFGNNDASIGVSHQNNGALFQCERALHGRYVVLQRCQRQLDGGHAEATFEQQRYNLRPR